MSPPPDDVTENAKALLAKKPFRYRYIFVFFELFYYMLSVRLLFHIIKTQTLLPLFPSALVTVVSMSIVLITLIMVDMRDLHVMEFLKPVMWTHIISTGVFFGLEVACFPTDTTPNRNSNLFAAGDLMFFICSLIQYFIVTLISLEGKVRQLAAEVLYDSIQTANDNSVSIPMVVIYDVENV